MKIKDYLKKKDMTLAQFSRKTGILYQTLFSISQKKTVSSYANAIKIVKASDGEITLEDIFENVLTEKE